MRRWVTSALRYLSLPKEITAFERAYLGRVNRVALWFFAAHLPIFVLVAGLNGGTGLQALVLTGLVLAGPAVAYRSLATSSPRVVSVLFGFVAMLMGGLLVHFGQGAMQIEMHFYFFVLIALLAVFANPMAILAAAGTVAVHHLVLYLFLPRSVFNYQASLWAVAVHALFVVLESVAACFVARTFFDNVIGLEQKVEERTRALAVRNQEMRLLLDNVEQGFLPLDANGVPAAERSGAAAWLVGEAPVGTPIWKLVARFAPQAAEWLELGWADLRARILPPDVVLDQMPKRLEHAGRVWALSYRPMSSAVDGGEPQVGDDLRVLLVMTDVTEQIARARSEAEQSDLMNGYARLVRDRAGFSEFLGEADRLVVQLDPSVANADVQRALHTLKGNAGLFGLLHLASLCHDAETALADDGEHIPAPLLAQVQRHWAGLKEKLAVLAGAGRPDVVEVSRADLRALLGAVLDPQVPRHELGSRISDLALEPAEPRMRRMAEQAQSVALRLQRPPLRVVMEGGDVRLPPRGLAELWSALVHAVRNAVDHGIEPPERRLAIGKPAHGTLTIRAARRAEHLIIEISDDGQGVVWSAVAARARVHGLRSETPADLVEALFHDGFSTRLVASEISGRGIGLAALRRTVERLGGRIDVESEPGVGTTLRLVIPWAEACERDRRPSGAVRVLSHSSPAAADALTTT